MTSDRIKEIRVGVFIDGSNMLWGSRASGIRIDWEKMKTYLKTRFNLVMLNYYAGEDDTPKPEHIQRSLNQKKFHKKLEKIGYYVIRKPLKHMASGTTKCDMDIEITMDIRTHENNIDCIILFSGDSDYLPVVDYYWKKGKYIRIFAFKESLSWELKTFCLNKPRCNFNQIHEIRKEIERIEEGTSFPQ